MFKYTAHAGCSTLINPYRSKSTITIEVSIEAHSQPPQFTYDVLLSNSSTASLNLVFRNVPNARYTPTSLDSTLFLPSQNASRNFSTNFPIFLNSLSTN